LTNHERQRRTTDPDEQRTHNPSATVKCRQTNANSNEEWKRIHGESKDKPAGKGNADCVEDEPKGKHGGGLRSRV
jgi:hypothetical protein